MRKIGFFLVLLIVASLVLLLPAHDLVSAPQIDFLTSNSSPLIAPSGPGEFLIAKRYDTGANPGVSSSTFAAAGDFNRDSKLDVVTVTGGDLYRALGNGDGTLQSPKLVFLASMITDVLTEDFNSDGNLDLVVVDNGTRRQTFLLLGNGKGSFTSSGNIYSGDCFTALVADFNNDGKPDLALSCSIVVVLLGNGDGTFQAAKATSVFGTLTNAAADVNHDGNVDLLIPDSLNGKVHVLLGNGDGTFHAGQDTTALQNALAVATTDFNKDGNPDLVVADSIALNILL